MTCHSDPAEREQGSDGVAQSFPLLETLRLFLKKEPQSLKGKTLRYSTSDHFLPMVSELGTTDNGQMREQVCWPRVPRSLPFTL